MLSITRGNIRVSWNISQQKMAYRVSDDDLAQYFIDELPQRYLDSDVEIDVDNDGNDISSN